METIQTYITEQSVLDCADGCGFKPTENALWFLLSLAREYYTKFNKKLHITSGARCYRHNADVGGVANSAHTRGLAFDVHYDNSRETYYIIQHLYKMGVPRIGINFNKSFVHFDIDTSLPQGVLFKY